MAWLDTEAGRITAAISGTESLGRLTMLLTADHGAHLDEDGSFGKHTFAPASARVPLIVWSSDETQPGSRRMDLASNADVDRTLLAAADVDTPADIGGGDLRTDDPYPLHISGIGYGAAASRAFPNHGKGTLENGSGGRSASA
ncbi:sulfatase-like hydrolase/transferase [Microbacterium sp. LWS13-1.2]|uniref:Sulfatase-like hydrolase/transferase n=1 Tax=Microbacterium sp. LWS13-1.2 TaxID=3135264 RepID=A0AAU6SEB7_9MICO